jgi:hypothetical protein
MTQRMAGKEEAAQYLHKELASSLTRSIFNYPRDEEMEPFLEYFRKIFGNNLLAVIFFGSCLSEETKTQTSFKDFFILVNSYRKASPSLLAAIGHKILPPDLYHLEIPMDDGKKAECKYYLISAEDFIKSSGHAAKDLYVMGRMSKRVALVYSRDEAATELIIECLASAAVQIANYASSLIQEPVGLEEFIQIILDLSYCAERRIEAGELKAQALYGIISRILVDEKILVQENHGKFLPGENAPEKHHIEKFLDISRARAKMRWPKMILTVDNWLDQLLAKFERTYNIKIEIPPWERKIVLITGWRHYFKAKREGRIH